MKKLILSIILTLVTLVTVQAQDSAAVEKPKLVDGRMKLSLYHFTNSNLKYAASDINLFIQKRKKGFNWPMTKMILYKENDQFTFEIVAIDNGWANLIEEGEEPYGFAIVEGRIFLIATKSEGEEINMDEYLIQSDQTRVFSFDPKQKPLAKNPRWYYLYEKELAYIKKSVNTDVMGK